METLVSCPVCNSDKQSHRLEVRDEALTKNLFQIVACGACGFCFTNPRPTAEELPAYYGFEDYISHTDTSSGLISKVYHLARVYATDGKVRLIKRLNKCEIINILDYGCGTGYFANASNNEGWKVRGVEPNDAARTIANSRLKGEKSVVETLNDLPIEETYEIITLWHVLEHVQALDETVVDLLKRLSPGGKLIVAVPNLASADAKHYGAYWAALDVPRHLYHFTPDTIRRLAIKHNAQVVQELPMYLDAFYISLLSERFKKGSAIQAIWQGIRSNVNALRDGETSSKIYIISKI